ncbi:CoA-acylating methylmalonate-semialdehyde dehydrogenase [Gracilibacillus kekensis]|uniref:Malonate-semialdehyde dehydrogenase n=1 Tax=Gracilibacillus kekensis TaxID=1027249 RepID=A0A1M7JKL9_9BACI|nr:CoA-acylating methylmalonate-semialdehyde dehydrogenase [Gracilibacillus kekensis]SHM53620.1 methylmalonate-semialdehyde dehydrogenase [acylating] [Gracilibacillus kekensis]
MVQALQNFINGKWQTATTHHIQEVPNPATGEILANVPISSKVDVNQAVISAKSAFNNWKNTPVPKRARILFKYQQLLLNHQEELAVIITKENGKSLKEAYGEVLRGIECVEFATGAPQLMKGETLSTIAKDIDSEMFRYPVGVIGGITPFNFPMMVPCWMFPLAIACGNTFVLKPSEKTPLLAVRLVELLQEAGLPDGVLNLVHGAEDVVNGFLEHDEVEAISFVGSQPVAEYVYQTAARYGKRVQALAGAKNHSIVLEDADLDASVQQIMNAAFGSAGERCMACSVVVAVEEIADTLVEKLVSASEQINIGNGLDESVFLGPVIREEHKQRTISYIEKVVQEGANICLDGRTSEQTEGFFVGPTILDNVETTMKIWQDEIFAPVLSVVRVKNLEEAIAVSNQSDFANGACLFTRDAKSIRTFREDIDAGMLGVNLGVPAPMAFFPFSGNKKSFYGDLHVNGTDGVNFYTKKKMITSRF